MDVTKEIQASFDPRKFITLLGTSNMSNNVQNKTEHPISNNTNKTPQTNVETKPTHINTPKPIVHSKKDSEIVHKPATHNGTILNDDDEYDDGFELELDLDALRAMTDVGSLSGSHSTLSAKPKPTIIKSPTLPPPPLKHPPNKNIDASDNLESTQNVSTPKTPKKKRKRDEP